MLVAGFDVGSRKVAITVMDVVTEQIVTYREVVAKKTSRAQEINEVVTGVEDLIPRIDFAVVEEPLIGRGTRASLMVTQTVGGLLHVLGAKPTTTTLVPVATWKKDVLGHGHSTKEDIRAWVEDTYGLHLKSQDLNDSVAIARQAVQLALRADVLSS